MGQGPNGPMAQGPQGTSGAGQGARLLMGPLDAFFAHQRRNDDEPAGATPSSWTCEPGLVGLVRAVAELDRSARSVNALQAERILLVADPRPFSGPEAHALVGLGGRAAWPAARGIAGSAHGRQGLQVPGQQVGLGGAHGGQARALHTAGLRDAAA